MEYMRWVRRWREEEEKIWTNKGGFNFSHVHEYFDIVITPQRPHGIGQGLL